MFWLKFNNTCFLYIQNMFPFMQFVTSSQVYQVVMEPTPPLKNMLSDFKIKS